MVKIFNDSGRKITVNSNFIQADFLDVTYNLIAGKFSPFRNPNNKPIYINTKTNHSPNITKQTADSGTVLTCQVSLVQLVTDKNLEVLNKA